MHVHCKCMLSNVFQSAGGHNTCLIIKVIKVELAVVTAVVVFGPH